MYQTDATNSIMYYGREASGDKTPGLSGFVLKVIAIISMAIDHIAASVLERYFISEGLFIEGSREYLVYLVMRAIGRIAFPIFCYFLVEGFFHTRSVAKYAVRLLIFAVISDIPFDLAIYKTWWYPYHNNVFLTLLIALLAMWGMREVGLHFSRDQEELSRQSVFGILLQIVIGVSAMALAQLLHTDYGASGVLTILIMFVFRKRPWLAALLGVLCLGVTSNPLEFCALPVVPLIYFYNGTRGRQRKYFFYVFYPTHFLILAGVCYLLGV